MQRMTSALGVCGGPTTAEVELIPITSLLPLTKRAIGLQVITAHEGHWWGVFDEGAFTSGAIVLILDREQRPVRAFRRRDS